MQLKKRTKLKNGGFDTYKKDKPTGVPVNKRNHRRTRLKRAMQPILERFGCTQMQAADRVMEELARNNKLQTEKDKNEQVFYSVRQQLVDKVEELELKLLTCEEQRNVLDGQVQQLKAKLAEAMKPDSSSSPDNN